MTNKVISHPHYIELVLVGDQDGSVTSETIEKAMIQANKLTKAKKPVLVLADASQVGSTHPDTYAASVRVVNEHPFDRIAMFGLAGSLSEKLMNGLIIGLGAQSAIRFFTERKEAEEWLLEKT
jgi:hypothetical protein